LIGLFLAIVLIPYLFAVSTSLKTDAQVQTNPPTIIPRPLQWKNYLFVGKVLPLGRYFRNSLIVSLSSTLIVVIFATFAAYAFSRIRFIGRDLIGLTQLATEMIPPILFLVPYYTLFLYVQRMIGLQIIGSYLPVIVTYVAFNLPVTTWLMRGYFDSISTSLEESAFLDGCSRTAALVRIVLPVALPGIITIAILTFIMSWNEILFASVLTNETTKTVALGIRDYRTKLRVNWNYMMSAGILVTIPSLVIFTFLQRYLVSGMTLGAVKE
jgi:multiple sugar transport system permease protein